VLRKRLFAGALASLLVLVGQAWAAPEYKIKQYNGVLGVEPGDYWDIPLPGQIRIKQILPNETFEFEAGMWDGQFYVGPAAVAAPAGRCRRRPARSWLPLQRAAVWRSPEILSSDVAKLTYAERWVPAK
jgi:hypothetical protein